MSASERIEDAIALRQGKSIPVVPLIISFAGRCAGMTQADIFSSLHKWQQALEATFARVGTPDAIFPLWPRDAAKSQMLRLLLPGDNLEVNAQFQYSESEVMSRDDYNFIIQKGYRTWFMQYLPRIRADISPGLFGRILTIRGFMLQGMRIKSNVNYWKKKMGLPAMFYAACYPAFDLFSLARSLVPFCHDLFDCPVIVEQAIKVATPEIVSMAKIPLRVTGGKRVCIYPMRSSASFISPKMFERFVLPSLKQMVDAFQKSRVVSVLHCDGNWAPMLPYLRELPRASCVVELDGMTDIFKAKEILGDWLCLKGDVPATLLAQGEPDQVSEYCQNLIRNIGSDGGFILSSGCEVPLDAKPENVAALIQSVHRV
jgi:uroporphyrinogen decarboxylase